MLYPWAFEPQSADPVLALCRGLAEAYAEGTGVNGTPYDTGTGRDHYGPGIGVGGELCDWVLVELAGTCLALTIELSPASANPGFILPSSAIKSVVDQNWNGLLKLLQVFEFERS